MKGQVDWRVLSVRPDIEVNGTNEVWFGGEKLTGGVYPAATIKTGYARIAAGMRKRGLVGRVGVEPTAR